MSTIFHAKYYAHELTRRFSSEKFEKLSQSLFNATVDLNPHQIEAALFAFRSPLSRGAILADEVGLGKTIEAGLIISQLWAERKRHILIILPAALREQWGRELLEKFFITSIILESKNFNQLIKQGSENPFEQADKIVLCSYHFARAKSEDTLKVPWDLVVVDEAHRLRNVYRKDNKIARTILAAVGNRPKVLLTATPLQNSLMELYGLVSFIDPHLFGSEDSFRSQYARRASEMSRDEFQALRARVQPVCHRTLRRQVVEYIRYTNRIPITQDFTPSAEEERLYNAVSTYLQREESYALPSGQRALMTLVLRKILASSSFAIANTLGSLVNRLETKISQARVDALPPMTEVLADDYESVAETQEEWDQSDSPNGADEDMHIEKSAQAIRQEAEELKQYKTLAESITHNAKGEALLLALKKGFEKAVQLGAPGKALIFTESRRTQRYLKELLQANGYAGNIVTLNGTNNDPDALHIYRDWLQRHARQDMITGSKSVDIRAALVEEFRERAAIMIATESGAEGINLQFCSLVVNYDLPWNPQRIEQRIGRCHRYGQKHDVVVINFLNRKNAADQRVFELLSEKFRLFDGVFGASDEVLGAIESGVDFEKRIHEIYQSSRTPEEIARAFDQLQLELEEQITAQLRDTRAKLLENFDADVHTRLRLNQDQTTQQITRFEEWLWRLTQYELGDCAFFDPDGGLDHRAGHWVSMMVPDHPRLDTTTGLKSASDLAILSHHTYQGEGWHKEVAVGTVIQDAQRGNDEHHQRWDRIARAELWGRYGDLHAQGLSQRQAAKVLAVPRSTLQAWLTYQENLDESPAVVAFFHSVPGLAFLHRLVLAFHLVCVEIGACGIRLVCLLLQLTGLNRFVGASYGTQQQVNRRVEEAIVAYRHEESARLAHEMPPKDITMTQDETFTGGLCLIGIEPVSNYILLEHPAQARDHDTWHALMEQALAGLNCTVMQSTSDEAPGLLAYVEHHLGVHHSPDLFHVQHELSKAVSAPMAAKQRAAHKAVVQAEETLNRGQALLANTNGGLTKRRPGRPPKAPMSREQAAQAVEAARQEYQRLAGQREQVTQSIRAIGHAYHFVDLDRGVRRNGKLIVSDIQRHIDTIRTIAHQEHLSETCRERLAKAERVMPKMQATIEFVSGYVRRQVQQLAVAPPASYAMHAQLIPACYLDRVASTRTVTAGEPLHALAERLRTPLFEPDGVFGALSPVEQDQLQHTAKRLAEVFQRSSSTVEGRNGYLSLRNHQLRGLDHPRKRACLTAIHNFFLTRPDGTTAAERFFGQKPRSMFAAILASIDIPPAPLSPPQRAGG